MADNEPHLVGGAGAGFARILPGGRPEPAHDKHEGGDKSEGAAAKEGIHNEVREVEGKKENIFAGFIDLSIWSMVIFLVLLFVLSKFAWKPMIEGLENREKRIHDELASAQKANEDAKALKADFEKKIDAAHQQVRAVIEEVRKNAAEMTEDMVGKAKSEIQAERDRLRRELDTAKDQALLELWQRSTQLATLVSSKAIRRQLTLDDQHRLVDEALNDLGVVAGDRQRVLASVQ